jgi:hypothetical protein
MLGTHPRLFIKDHFPEPNVQPSGALLMGAGNSSAQPRSTAADKNFLSFYLKSSATSGTSRGMYLRLYVDSGAGGEALRAFTTVSSDTPADTVNGAHVSLSFGSSAGNVTGEGQAVRGTFHLPASRAMTGTLSAIKAELYADGSNASNYASNLSFLRFSAGGHADFVTTQSATLTGFYLFSVDGLAAGGDGVNSIFRSVAPSTLAASLKVKVGSTVYYLPLYSGQS